MAKIDPKWKETQDLYNWTLPPAAPLIYRLPLIRHIRYLYLSYKVELFYSYNILGIRSGYDEWVLYAIKQGLV